MNSYFRLSPLIASALLLGCAGHTEYVPPSASATLPSSRTIDLPRDQVWNKLVPELSKKFFVINTIDKQSGLINISYSGNPESYIDCGQASSYVKNFRGERSYQFPGARAQQNYEVMSGGNLVFVNRKLELEGRVNLIVEQVTPKQTRLTASTRYIVARHLELSNPQGQNAANNSTINFNTGGSGTFPGGQSTQPTTCKANGTLEAELIGLAG